MVMPAVPTDAELLEAANRYNTDRRASLAVTSRELGLNIMTFSRFLKTGRAIGRTKLTLRDHLVKHEYLNEVPRQGEPISKNETHQMGIIVLKVIESLLVATRDQIAQQATIDDRFVGESNVHNR